MNIFFKVTLRTLSRNKTRTLVTIIGIILSAAMLTAVTAFMTSLRGYMLNVAVHNNGDWHGCLYEAGPDKTAELEGNPDVIQVVENENIGYAALPNPIFEYSPYIYIIGTDSDFNTVMPVNITGGRLPQRVDEIILPEHLLRNGGTDFSIGDRITLDIGIRMYENTVLNQQNIYMKGQDGATQEELVIQEARAYTVVGFYERPRFEDQSSPGYTAITAMDGAKRGDKAFDVYFKLKKPKGVYDFIRAEEQKEGFGGSSYNDDVLLYSGVSKYSSFYSVLYSLAAILILLIMAGSVSLIFNAFSISVSERTKQIGLLSSVGATHRQIRKSILFEALFVSIIGIPIGVLSGLTGIGVTLSLIGKRFSSLYSSEVPYSLSLQVNVWTVVTAVLFALITVLISAWIPSRRATRITAIEAIRQTNDISVRAKDIRTSKLTYRLFGLEGILARKHFRRSKKGYRTTVASLFMSIVLFISASSFCSYIKDSVNDVFETRDYDISWYYNTDTYTEMTPREVYELLAQTNGLTNATYAFVKEGYALISKDDILDEFKERFDESPDNGEGNSDVYRVTACAYIVPDEVFDGYTAAENLHDVDAVTMAYVESIDAKTNKYTKTNILSNTLSTMNVKLLDESEEPIANDLTQEELEALIYKNTTINIGAIVDSLPFAISGSHHGYQITVMVPERSVSKYFANMDLTDVVYYFKGEEHAVLADNLITVMNENGLPSEDIHDSAVSEDTDRNLIFIVSVFSYGFIILISLIAAANVFNTISTGISLRRREFAMLKSVGMTQKGFRKMMNYECLMYGTKSLMWGLPVAVGVTYLIYRSINAGYITSFYIPWTSLVVAIFSVFAVVFATMLYSMNKIKNDNTIDSLRNENL
jgi:putative ABC transport system permease protein